MARRATRLAKESSEMTPQSSPKIVAIQIRASGRRCAVDCPHITTYADDSGRCILFGVRLNRDMKARQLRASVCRKAEI
jgi:hypothetical protein